MIYVVISDTFNLSILDKNNIFIGVEKGCLNIIKHNLELNYAIGDFDSIGDNLSLIKDSALNFIKLNEIKDETDTLEALKIASSIDSSICLIGGISGNRIEHFIANINLFSKFENLEIIDEFSHIRLIDKLCTTFNNDYKYHSLFSYTDFSTITISGFKYNLDNYKLERFNSLCISNEIINNPVIDVLEGKVLLISSKYDK